MRWFFLSWGTFLPNLVVWISVHFDFCKSRVKVIQGEDQSSNLRQAEFSEANIQVCFQTMSPKVFTYKPLQTKIVFQKEKVGFPLLVVFLRESLWQSQKYAQAAFSVFNITNPFKIAENERRQGFVNKTHLSMIFSCISRELQSAIPWRGRIWVSENFLALEVAKVFDAVQSFLPLFGDLWEVTIHPGESIIECNSKSLVLSFMSCHCLLSENTSESGTKADTQCEITAGKEQSI